MLGVEIDVQIGQMTLRSRHLSALSADIANQPDVLHVFGDSTIQVSNHSLRVRDRVRVRVSTIQVSNHSTSHSQRVSTELVLS